ncbi:MAG: CehA/McbA family metallohydrolase [Chloroflexi bacterium]|nr:CehA/McbA family metallohydrolase [Chloroflexota bacterium]
MNTFQDGPASPLFTPLVFNGNTTFEALSNQAGVSPELAAAALRAPRGDCTAWGIPFVAENPVLISANTAELSFAPADAKWLVFMHTSDLRPSEAGPDGLAHAQHGRGRLNELAAVYTVLYADGAQERIEIRRRHQIGAFTRGWGENCFQAVAHHRPMTLPAAQEQQVPPGWWGCSQTRADAADGHPWTNWLYAWQNPHPQAPITGLRCEAAVGAVVLSAVSAGSVTEQPLRWRTRRKAVFALPAGEAFLPELDERGQLAQIKLDLGNVISARPRLRYPNETWEQGFNNQLPEKLANEIIVEYTCHPEARFYLAGGRVAPAAAVEAAQAGATLVPVTPATRRVLLRVIERQSGQPVAVKLHVHGAAGEYLAPVDRHRIINPAWFEDYSPDFTHQNTHSTTYIAGETVIDLPLGRVYIEISKGFEIKPLRIIREITPATDTLTVEIEKVLPWREQGWVTADTHVHFLSPMTAMLEGAGEGVNIVNLLASQWGELMTNVGDFDGKTTWGTREAGGDGEWLVRVGTENRQHILGHISLLGYNGRVIAPMTTGGPDEAALGDPVDMLLTEWARQCKAQGGLVVLPHFPNPRAEHAASIIAGDIDAVEMTAWNNLYAGIDPYSLSDWYRYLNCGALVAAVGGTDKMTSMTAVGTVRTYARIARDQPFTYEAWMEAVRRAETFVTYGPLLEFAVNGQPMGSKLALPRGGGTLDITWQARSVTTPMTRAELVVNGEIRESVAVDAWNAGGSWRLRVPASAWCALLIRGQYPGIPEMIAAHSSPVMALVEGSELLAAADAVTILEQIEGALAYIDTVGTRAEDAVYKRTRLVLEGAKRRLHNRMHEAGYYHAHTAGEEHEERG